ncbi:MAG: dihydroorotate dehydrogenase-like protein [Chloroflexi bacterium]|nr:dihydroorotate dehydrogenase-like protein [Chloroflexota bacterium]
MADLATTYLGLKLRTPLIVGSSELTDSPAKVEELEKKGAGAVVLKSIFEEEIAHEYRAILREELKAGSSAEAVDYLDQALRAENLDRYKQLVADCKKRVDIPVIASVNCTYSHEWAYFAGELVNAGADALELNMFFSPSDLQRTREEAEAAYFRVVERVREQASCVPVALKVSSYFTDLGSMLLRLCQAGVTGLVLFNRFWAPDFDIDKLEIVPSRILSTPEELATPLRWIAIMSGRLSCDLAASTGIHDAAGLIKVLLAGAKAGQVVSTLYKNGTGHIQTILDGLTEWMEKHEFLTVEQFRGLMSQKVSANPAVYERVQFMRYYGGLFQGREGGVPGGMDALRY